VFRENAIDSAVLPNLTAEDLKDLGVVLIGHRRRLLDAIAARRVDVTLPRAGSAPSAPERRQLTVAFCDLVGSTPLSARLDPEELRGIIGAYHRCVQKLVDGTDGLRAASIGDAQPIQVGEELLFLPASAREGSAELKPDPRRAYRYRSRKSVALRTSGIAGSSAPASRRKTSPIASRPTPGLSVMLKG